ncbi:hypothetical protein [Terriglobus saanensis]|uniref:hypothetical protein n=1 Tax=Terriglobus saanensis TaxID=870903 RepID=UPI001C9DCB04|nr:hypothetical protein [Terriglobus saanensis]
MKSPSPAVIPQPTAPAIERPTGGGQVMGVEPIPLIPIFPDAPSTVWQSVQVTATPMPPLIPVAMRLTPCPGGGIGCSPTSPRQLILNSRFPDPVLSPSQKLELAGRNFIDPFNLAVIGLSSGIAVAADSRSAYGPGMAGFGRNVGVALTGDLTGNFFGVFAIPALTHQDPRYHRMPEGTVTRRIVHALSRTIIAQGDHGETMPNYSTLLTYPIAIEIGNLYVPGVQSDAKSTGRRVMLSYATDPISNLISEFLPDVARRIHIRSVFFQQILTKIALQPTTSQEAATP